MARYVQFQTNGRDTLGSEGSYIPDRRYGLARIAEEAKDIAYRHRHVHSYDSFEIRTGNYDGYTVLYSEELSLDYTLIYKSKPWVRLRCLRGDAQLANAILAPDCLLIIRAGIADSTIDIHHSQVVAFSCDFTDKQVDVLKHGYFTVAQLCGLSKLPS